MIYILLVYLWLFIHRPFEVWKFLADMRVERVYAIFCILSWALLYPGKTWVSNRINAAFLFFWLVLVASWLTSPYPDEGARVAEDYYKYIVAYALILGTVRGQKGLKILTGGYLIIVGVYMTHSLREYFCGRHVYRQGIARMIGIDLTFNDPNTFAATILYSLPITLAFWHEAKGKWARRALYYYTCLTISCIVLTGSRSGFVGLLVFGMIVFAPSIRSLRKFLPLVVLLPLGWMVIPNDLQNRFWTVIDPSVGPESAHASAEGRTQGFTDGLENWAAYPVLGVGPGAHGRATGKGYQTHNVYGQVLGETGTLGALAFLGFLACFVMNHLDIRRFRVFDDSPETQFAYRLSGGIIISVVLLLVKGWGDHNLFRYTWLWFGAFQAIALDLCRSHAAAAVAWNPGRDDYSSEQIEFDNLHPTLEPRSAS